MTFPQYSTLILLIKILIADLTMLSLLGVDTRVRRLALVRQDLGREQHLSHPNWTISEFAHAIQALEALAKVRC
jgi:hypothetical protein